MVSVVEKYLHEIDRQSPKWKQRKAQFQTKKARPLKGSPGSKYRKKVVAWAKNRKNIRGAIFCERCKIVHNFSRRSLRHRMLSSIIVTYV